MSKRACLALAGVLCLAACNDEPAATGPATASVSEQEALRDAAEVIEQRPIPAEVMAQPAQVETSETREEPAE